jgi:arylsulfatase A-like enzyme
MNVHKLDEPTRLLPADGLADRNVHLVARRAAHSTAGQLAATTVIPLKLATGRGEPKRWRVFLHAGTRPFGSPHARTAYAITLAALLAVYFTYNLVFRWLSYELFQGAAVYGWARPGRLELSFLIAVTLIPVAIWGALGSFVGSRLRPSRAGLCLGAASVVVLLLVELDNSWYSMAKRHATFEDVATILSLDPFTECGLHPRDVARLAGYVVTHLIATAMAVVAAAPLSRSASVARFAGRIKPLRAAGVLAALLVVEGTCASIFKLQASDLEHSQWHTVLDHHPLRIGLLDALLEAPLSPLLRDTRAANAEFEQWCRAELAPYSESGPIAALPAPSVDGAKNVLLITLESLNPSYIDARTMPYLTRLAGRSVSLRRHYSAGNSTHLAMLGLLFGEPPAFYDGGASHDVQQSAYIDEFNRRGYRTRVYCKERSLDSKIEDHLANFREPPLGIADAWQLAAAFREDWARPEPKYALLYYFPTHFPYQHALQFTHVTPESPEDCDYLKQDTVEARQQVRNRYRNCLREADAWLEYVLQAVDLRSTIVVITGDHGEELFECGRLGHASALDEPQIRVPCIVSLPGGTPQAIDSVTSHNDLMPSIIDALGWEALPEASGRSIFRAGPPSAAVVAGNARSGRVKQWAMIVGERKLIFSARDEGRPAVRIEDLYDLHDNRQHYATAPADWHAAFDALRAFSTSTLAP